jgi:hypothetical protein
MTFREAIEALKGGHRIARPEWGDEGAWLMLRRGRTGRITHLMPHGVAMGGTPGDNTSEAEVTCAPHISMYSSAGEIRLGWIPSHEDMLAEGWVILE